MARYKEDEILGYHWNGGTYCDGCVPDKGECSQDDLITAHDLKDGDRYFCDGCKKEITE